MLTKSQKSKKKRKKRQGKTNRKASDINTFFFKSFSTIDLECSDPESDIVSEINRAQALEEADDVEMVTSLGVGLSLNDNVVVSASWWWSQKCI